MSRLGAQRRATLAAAIALGAVCPSAASQPSDWPHWRGPSFNNAATAPGIFAKPFDLRVRWRKAIGTGYSAVVVAQGHAVTMASDGKTDFLISLSSDSGKENWRIPLGEAFPGRDGSTGGPVSTPALANGVAYALGPRGEFVAVELATGKLLWKRQIASELGAEMPHWGFTTSPVVVRNLVVLQTGGEGATAVTAFDRKTGATVWRSGSDTVKYSSPILVQLEGRELLLWGGDKAFAALDPATGREVWRLDHGGKTVSTGIPLGISPQSNFLNPLMLGAGRILLHYRYADEAVQLNVSASAPPQMGWASRELKLSFATPVVHGSMIFGYSGGFLSCVDASAGTLLWRSRAPGGGFPLIVDGHLVVLTNQGAVVVAEASPAGYQEKLKFEVFSREVWSPPAFAEGRIYARDSYAEIAAVDIVPRASVTTAAAPAKPPLGTAPSSQFAQWVAEVAGKPDAPARVQQFLTQQKSFPIIEGERYAHIVYQGDEKEVFLVSDALEWGQEITLHRVAGTKLHYASFDLAPDARIAYQLERGLGESFTDPRNPLRAGRAYVTGGEVSLLLMPRADRSLPAASTPLRGRMLELEMESPVARAEALSWGGKRKLHVYLPPGYDAATAQRYPVLYVLYGAQMLSDARLQHILDREIGSSLRPLIAVFVESNNAYELARTFREPHRRMLAEQLVPLIDSRFRTLAQPAQRALLGGHEAGFAALEAGLSYPQVFGNIIAQSALPLSTGERDLLALMDRAPTATQRFFVDWGAYDLRSASDLTDVGAFTRQAHDRLRTRGYHVRGRELSDGTALIFRAGRALHFLRQIFPRP